MTTALKYIRTKYGCKNNLSATKYEAQMFGVPYPVSGTKYSRARLSAIILTPKQINALMVMQSKKGGVKDARRMNRLVRAFGPVRPMEDYEKIKKREMIVALSMNLTSAEKDYYASPEFLQSYQWRALRLDALDKYGRRCVSCGSTVASGAVLNVDHIRPRKYFPELALSMDNLQILCQDCNHGKGNTNHTDYRP